MAGKPKQVASCLPPTPPSRPCPQWGQLVAAQEPSVNSPTSRHGPFPLCKQAVRTLTHWACQEEVLRWFTQSTFLLQEGTVSQQNRTTRRGSFHEISHYSDCMVSCEDTAGLVAVPIRLLTSSPSNSDPSLELPSAGPVANQSLCGKEVVYWKTKRKLELLALHYAGATYSEMTTGSFEPGVKSGSLS